MQVLVGGRSGDERKIPWVSWDSVCLGKKEGGLGVKNLEWFNKALLGKWVWRFFANRNSLWGKVLRSRYGDLVCKDGGISFADRRGGRGGWWGKIVSLLGGEKGKWFGDKLRIKLGNGMNTSFWEGQWAGEQSLRVKFPRLFNLSVLKNGLVGEFGEWVNGAWYWSVKWRRDLLGREIDLANNLLSCIHRVNLEESMEDRWTWNGNHQASDFVKQAYLLLSNDPQNRRGGQESNDNFSLVWKAVAPRKAACTAWRLLRKRLPTYVNLAKRGVICNDGGLCSCCGQIPETESHLFIGCAPIVGVWYNVVAKLGIAWSPPQSIDEHLWQFANLLGGKKKKRFLGGLWICVVWIIWKWRNKVIFEKMAWDYRKIEEEIYGRFSAWIHSLVNQVSNIPAEIGRIFPLAAFSLN